MGLDLIFSYTHKSLCYSIDQTSSNRKLRSTEGAFLRTALSRLFVHYLLMLKVTPLGLRWSACTIIVEIRIKRCKRVVKRGIFSKRLPCMYIKPCTSTRATTCRIASVRRSILRSWSMIDMLGRRSRQRATDSGALQKRHIPCHTHRGLERIFTPSHC